jgi:hypothetical protein
MAQPVEDVIEQVHRQKAQHEDGPVGQRQSTEVEDAQRHQGRDQMVLHRELQHERRRDRERREAQDRRHVLAPSRTYLHAREAEFHQREHGDGPERDQRRQLGGDQIAKARHRLACPHARAPR